MKFFSKGELNLLWPFYLDGIFAALHFLRAFIFVYFNTTNMSTMRKMLSGEKKGFVSGCYNYKSFA